MEATTIQTRRGFFTFEEAMDCDWDVIPDLFLLEHHRVFCENLSQLRPQITLLLARHLGIPTTQFRLSDESEWISGGFNICLPIHIDNSQKSGLPRKVIIRFGLPFNCGETFRPGSIDEKLRSEAATYLWLQGHCPSIPITQLLGMGFPGSQSVAQTHHPWPDQER